MDKLKELLGEELYNSLVAKLGNTKLVIDDGKLIPKHRLDEVLTEKKTLEDAVAKHESDLKTLKEQAVGNDKLLAKITTLEAERDTAKSEALKTQTYTKKAFALNVDLFEAGVTSERGRKLLAKEFDIDKLELTDDGKVKNFAESFKPIREDKAFSSLIGNSRIEGTEHGQGGNPPPVTDLEVRLAAAQKAGKTVEVVSLKRQIAESQTKG